MPPRTLLLLACSLFARWSLGCGGGSAEDAAECGPPRALDGGMTPLPAEIDAIVERRCRECHADPPPPELFAPMPLVSFEHFHAPMPAPRDDEPVHVYVRRRIHDERYPMPPVTREPLTDEERATLDAWLEDCAPPASD